MKSPRDTTQDIDNLEKMPVVMNPSMNNRIEEIVERISDT